MRAPEALSALLNAVAPGRRRLSVDAVAAAVCSNLTLVSNMTVFPFTHDPFLCPLPLASNMTKPPAKLPLVRFRARLRDAKSVQHGVANFAVDRNQCAVEYDLHLTGRLETVSFGNIGVPAAVLEVSPPGAITVEYVLTAGRGEIALVLPCLTALQDLEDAFASGHAVVHVQTTTYAASGQVHPA